MRAIPLAASPVNALRTIKLVHTAAWAFFAACVFAIPVFAWRANYRYALQFIGIVFLEVLLLVVALPAHPGRRPLHKRPARQL